MAFSVAFDPSTSAVDLQNHVQAETVKSRLPNDMVRYHLAPRIIHRIVSELGRRAWSPLDAQFLPYFRQKLKGKVSAKPWHLAIRST